MKSCAHESTGRRWRSTGGWLTRRQKEAGWWRRVERECVARRKSPRESRKRCLRRPRNNGKRSSDSRTPEVQRIASQCAMLWTERSGFLAKTGASSWRDWERELRWVLTDEVSSRADVMDGELLEREEWMMARRALRAPVGVTHRTPLSWHEKKGAGGIIEEARTLGLGMK